MQHRRWTGSEAEAGTGGRRQKAVARCLLICPVIMQSLNHSRMSDVYVSLPRCCRCNAVDFAQLLGSLRVRGQWNPPAGAFNSVLGFGFWACASAWAWDWMRWYNQEWQPNSRIAGQPDSELIPTNWSMRVPVREALQRSRNDPIFIYIFFCWFVLFGAFSASN